MTIGNIFITILNTYYVVHCLRMTRKANRELYQVNNIELQKLRKKPMKTLEEQKKFLDIKYPKRPEKKIKKTRKQKHQMATGIIFSIVLYISVFNLNLYVVNLIGLQLKMWQAILYIVVMPLIFNIILEKFNMQKSDLRMFLKF